MKNKKKVLTVLFAAILAFIAVFFIFRFEHKKTEQVAPEQKIEEQKCLYDSCGITSKRPWIFLISDGEPTDYGWEESAEICRYAQKNKKVVIHAIGTQGANLEKLAKFSILPPKRLTGLKFTEFFLWLSRSVSCISKAAPNANHYLDDINDWNEKKN